MKKLFKLKTLGIIIILLIIAPFLFVFIYNRHNQTLRLENNQILTAKRNESGSAYPIKTTDIYLTTYQDGKKNKEFITNLKEYLIGGVIMDDGRVVVVEGDIKRDKALIYI